MAQLCKHWAHKFEVQLTGDVGVIRFGFATATMRADDSSLLVEVSGGDAETVAQLESVVQEHLDRFAFREAPLPFEWARATQ
jgi:hypothetical protein